jgi:hypothetical protein
MTLNALATIAPPQLAYAEMERLATDFAQSRLFGFKTKQEAMSIMMLAQAEGKHPATAARDYDVIQGRPAKRAEAMHRDFMDGGGKITWHTLTDEMADATFSHPQGGEVRISWDMARALQAGLSTKENWKKYPRQMLRNRTLSEGVRTVWPGATSGMYEPGEIADFTGKTIDGTAETEASPEREAINSEVPMKAAAADMPRTERLVDKAKVYETPPKSTPAVPRTLEQWNEWMDEFEPRLASLLDRRELNDMTKEPAISDAIAKAPPRVRKDIDALLAHAYGRLPEPDLSDEALGEVEIAGEDKVMSGDD